MKRLVSIAIVLISISSVALAQTPGSIGIFVDQLGNDCNIYDTGPPGILPVYVVHVGTSGSTASQWMFTKDPTVTLAYTGESSPFQTIVGNSQTGITIGYGGCFTGTFLVSTINMFGTGTSPTCGFFNIVPDTAYTAQGMVQIVGCAPDYTQYELTKGGQARINPDITCMCNVAVQESTWGRVKALYAE